MSNDDVVRLGLMAPLTGVVKIYGPEISMAAKIACQEVNAEGGVLGRRLELVIEDDGSLPESAVSAAEILVNRHRCVSIIGNLLSNSRIAVAYRVAEPLRVPYLNFSFYEGGIFSKYFFHFAALPNQQIDKMIPFMQKRYGSKMFFAGNSYEWPRGSIDAAKRVLVSLDGEIVGEEYLPIGVGPAEIERLMDSVAESGADVFVPYFAGTDQVQLLSAFSAKGLKRSMAVVMGHYDEAMASQLPPEVREGFYSSNTYFMSVDTPENSRYLERLEAMPGITGIWPHGNGILTNFGEGAYLCVKAFARAANKAGRLDSEALVTALETIQVTGPQGAVAMDPETHHAQVNTYLSRCRADGTFEVIESFGSIEPVIPDRYRHLQMSGQARSEEDIRLQARMMEQMAEAVLLVKAEDGTIVYSNPNAERMFGYQNGEMIGKFASALSLLSDRDDDTSIAHINKALYRKGVWRGELRGLGKDGSTFWASASVFAFTHAKYGEVWMSMLNDITESRRAKEELEKSTTLFSTLARVAPVGIFRADLEGKCLYVNDKWVTLSGRKREDALGMGWIQAIHPDDRERVFAAWRQAAQGTTPFNMEYRYQSPDGKIVWLLGQAEAEVDREGRVIAYVGTVTDITDQKRVAAKLLAAKNLAEEVARGRTKFLDIAAHELRTPVTAISLLLEVLQREIQKGQAPSLDILARIHDPVKRLTRLVVDLLDVSRLDRGLVVLRPVVGDIVSLVSNCVDEFRLQAPKRRVTFTPSDSKIELSLDTVRINQVLSNLIDNAIKYTGEGSPIEVTVEKSERNVRVSVIDHGAGIPADQQAGLFNAFTRGSNDATVRTRGLGLGLSVCHGIVDLHRGRIGVESEPGRGSTFYFELPMDERIS